MDRSITVRAYTDYLPDLPTPPSSDGLYVRLLSETQPMPPSTIANEVVQLQMSPDEMSAAYMALEVLHAAEARISGTIKALHGEYADALAAYNAATAPLGERYDNAVALDETLHDIMSEAEEQARREAAEAEAAAVDALRGPRTYAKTPNPSWTYKHGPNQGRWVVHQATCSKVSDRAATIAQDDADGYGASLLRADDAARIVVDGGNLCGLCKPDEPLIAGGAALLVQVRAAREAKPVPVPQHELLPLAKSLKLDAAHAEANGGFLMLVERPGRVMETFPSEKVLGWRTAGGNRITGIPEQHREQLMGAARSRPRWVSRWSRPSLDEMAGFLAVRMMTKAEWRAAQDAAQDAGVASA